MAQHMRADLFVDTRRQGPLPDDLPEAAAAHPFAAVADKEQGARPPFKNQRSGPLQVFLYCIPGRFAEGNHPFFATFSEDSNTAAAYIATVDGEGDQFRDPDAGGIEKM